MQKRPAKGAAAPRIPCDTPPRARCEFYRILAIFALLWLCRIIPSFAEEIATPAPAVAEKLPAAAPSVAASEANRPPLPSPWDKLLA
ncbi:MAG: hypothetical protein V1918_07790, partial [Planctomycetota bacterium]